MLGVKLHRAVTVQEHQLDSQEVREMVHLGGFLVKNDDTWRFETCGYPLSSMTKHISCYVKYYTSVTIAYTDTFNHILPFRSYIATF